MNTKTEIPVVLALDLATRFGYAVGSADRVPIFGAVKLQSTGPEIGRFICEYEDWLTAEIERIRAALRKAKKERRVVVVFEKAILPGARTVFKGGKKILIPAVTSPIVVAKLNGLACETERYCFRNKIACREAHMQSVRKFFVGKGNAKKPDTIQAARNAGFKLEDDQNDEADAIATHAYASNMLAKAAGWYALREIGNG